MFPLVFALGFAGFLWAGSRLSHSMILKTVRGWRIPSPFGYRHGRQKTYDLKPPQADQSLRRESLSLGPSTPGSEFCPLPAWPQSHAAALLGRGSPPERLLAALRSGSINSPSNPEVRTALKRGRCLARPVERERFGCRAGFSPDSVDRKEHPDRGGAQVIPPFQGSARQRYQNDGTIHSSLSSPYPAPTFGMNSREFVKVLFLTAYALFPQNRLTRPCLERPPWEPQYQWKHANLFAVCKPRPSKNVSP